MARAASSTFTIFWVPQRAGGLRRFTVSGRQLRGLGSLLSLVALGVVALCAHYLSVCAAAHRHRLVRADNVQLRTRLYDVQAEVFELEARLWRMEQVAQRLQALTALHDPERDLSLARLPSPPSAEAAGVLFASEEAIDEENVRLDSPLGRAMARPDLGELSRRAREREAQLQQVESVYADSPGRLSTTPSIAPVDDPLVVVPFGPRTDPYTQASGLHPGVDLSAALAAPVVATGAGRVLEAGWREGGGGLTVVVEHGGGHTSLYGHLGAVHVVVGQHLRRGERLGEVGHSGRARGPQLHYEVRFFGVPQDPEATFVGP